MYLGAEQIVTALQGLSNVHPFHGITYLTCKKARLPVGRQIEFAMDTETLAFLRQYHRVDPASAWFYQPFKSTDLTKKWVRHDYAASGLQAINTQTFGPAFLHQPRTRIWGWASNYLQVLIDKLVRGQKVPAFRLAVWIMRDRDWAAATTPKDILNAFFADFHIEPAEQTALFDTKLPATLTLFPDPLEPKELLRRLPPAPDAKPDEGGTLGYLETTGLGPSDRLVFAPAKRLSLITGDNGLGKSFILDAAWWALTGQWADRPMYPATRDRSVSSITFAIEGSETIAQRRTIAFDWKTMSWPRPKNRPTIPGLIVYARVDGSFAVWDPARLRPIDAPESTKVVLTRSDVWDGLSGRIEGLVRDWVRWQTNPGSPQFETFKNVLAKLSPPDLGTLRPGKPVRIPDDPRDIPTLIHPYGEVPIVNASAGVRRIVTLAYLIVWAWHEHLVTSQLSRREPQRRMVVLIDEIEAHLHPKWQRSLLPALMEVNKLLASELEAQYIIATHSPLVMASSEVIFESDRDKLFHLELDGAAHSVSLNELDFVKFGDVSSWLTSPIFELRHARSNEADAAIETAKKIQLQADPSRETVQAAHDDLKRSLAPDDRFWPRWISYAERFGVDV